MAECPVAGDANVRLRLPLAERNTAVECRKCCSHSNEVGVVRS